MRGASQRHELTFLAIAVAVLVLALGLFVALRVRSRRQTKPPDAQQVEQEQRAASKQTPPEKAKSERDPFAQRQRQTQQGGVRPEVALKLVGIVDREGTGPVAVIRSGERRFYARQGEQVAGYWVTAIETDRVVLRGQGGDTILLLRQPEGAAGGG